MSPYGLTDRQCDVARLVAQGRRNKAIGEELGISYWTVLYHVRQMGRKLPGTGSPRERIAAWHGRNMARAA